VEQSICRASEGPLPTLAGQPAHSSSHLYEELLLLSERNALGTLQIAHALFMVSSRAVDCLVQFGIKLFL